MKRFLLISLPVVALLAAGAYYLYHALMPRIIAEAVVSESIPAYIPKRLKNKVEQIRTPINKGTEAMIEQMRSADIPLDQVLDAVDEITEEQAYAFLDDMNQKKPKTTNEVFDLAKEHFPTTFSPEVFRGTFNTYFKMEQVEDAMVYANLNRRSMDVDINTAKAIVKKIIIEKEREMRN